MIESNEKYFELLKDIKETLISTRNRIVESANKELILNIFYRYISKRLKNRIS